MENYRAERTSRRAAQELAKTEYERDQQMLLKARDNEKTMTKHSMASIAKYVAIRMYQTFSSVQTKDKHRDYLANANKKK